MIQAVEPWWRSFRTLAMRCPARPSPDHAPVVAPPGLEPPPALPENENGYLHVVELHKAWPNEGRYPPDLKHWIQVGKADRAGAERALAPLRSVLENSEGLFGAKVWQASITFDGDWPEIFSLRRLGQAFILRGLLEDRPQDRDHAIELSVRLRRSQGTLLHFIVAHALEKAAAGPFEGLEEDRREAVRWKLARMEIPSAHLADPWSPTLGEPTPNVIDQLNACRWAIDDYSQPYDPQATIQMMLSERELMASGTSVDLARRSKEVGRNWPAALHVPGGPPVPLFVLWLLRKGLRESKEPNPYGEIKVAQLLHVAAGTAQMVERARAKPR